MSESTRNPERFAPVCEGGVDPREFARMHRDPMSKDWDEVLRHCAGDKAMLAGARYAWICAIAAMSRGWEETHTRALRVCREGGGR